MSESMKAESRITVAEAYLSGAGRLVAPPRSPASRETWRGVFRDVLGTTPARILDVGSGRGDAALLLHDLGHYPHGVDRDLDQVRRARAAADGRCAAVPFHVGDAEQLDFPAAVFDAVHARELLAQLPHPMWALAEWFRVLRPGGTLVVVERVAADGLRSPELLRAAGFSDVRTRDVEAPRSRWLPRWALLATERCAVTWGRRAS